MKSTSSQLATHLTAPTTTLATLWRITLTNGTVFTVTDHNEDIVYGGETYSSALGYRRAAISTGSDLAVDETELECLLNADFVEEQALRAGVWDFAEVRIFAVNYTDVGQGEIKFRKGTLGEVIVRDDGSFFAEFRGLSQRLQQIIGDLYETNCRRDLGDSKCRIPLRPSLRQNSTSYSVGTFVRVQTDGSVDGVSYDEEGFIYECTTAGVSASSQPSFVLGAGSTTTDGSVVWTCRTAWTRPATIETVTDAVTLVLVADGVEAFGNAYFDAGVAIWETGENAGVSREVVGWDQATRTLSLLGPPPFTPAVGDILRIQPGCDKTKAVCRGMFNNYAQFRGFPFVPGAPGLASTSP